MTREDAILIHGTIDRNDPATYITAANIVMEASGQQVDSINAAIAVLRTLFMRLLDTDRYTEAALLCWGTRLFDPRPRAVQRLWNKLQGSNKTLVMGGGSQGKSYTGIAWHILDYQRDPAYTAIKLVSTTAGHAKANTWSTLVRFHRESVIPFAGEIQSNYIGLDADDKHASIAIVAIPPGEDGKARLQGFHPLPRVAAHPIFGDLSRVRLFIDEAEDAPAGLWQGVGNMLGNEDMIGSVKVYAATNPKNKASVFAQMAEPYGGWDSISVETEEWISAQGWTVMHLDPATSENVVQRRIVFGGMMTYEGFQNYVRLGENHPSYWTFARGWYPTTAASYCIVAPYITGELRGVYTFQRVIANVASLDPAFEEGGDMAILTTGRYGLANGFVNAQGGYEDFTANPRYVIQAEQQFPLDKCGGKTIELARSVIAILRDLKVTPEWMVMDRTGNAKGLYDVLQSLYGDVLGIMWGEGATDKMILEEDSDMASERYIGVVSEMWFAFALWAEHGFIKLAPSMPTGLLFSQLTSRQYKRMTKTLQQVESKADYKKRNGGRSPDEADSMIMLPHLIRMRASANAAFLPENQTDPQKTEQRRRDEDWINLVPRRNGGVGGAVDPHRVKFVTLK